MCQLRWQARGEVEMSFFFLFSFLFFLGMVSATYLTGLRTLVSCILGDALRG